MTSSERTVVQDATSESYPSRPASDESGVDLTLIREYLKLSPIERLRSLQNAVRAIGKFRRVALKLPR